jgi:hypothetical protein
MGGMGGSSMVMNIETFNNMARIDVGNDHVLGERAGA